MILNAILRDLDIVNAVKASNGAWTSATRHKLVKNLPRIFASLVIITGRGGKPRSINNRGETKGHSDAVLCLLFALVKPIFLINYINNFSSVFFYQYSILFLLGIILP